MYTFEQIDEITGVTVELMGALGFASDATEMLTLALSQRLAELE